MRFELGINALGSNISVIALGESGSYLERRVASVL